jgi:hypothetical protein
MSSATLQKGMKIVLNALGLVSHNSMRGVNEGITYFGRKKNIKKANGDPNSTESTTKVLIML